MPLSSTVSYHSVMHFVATLAVIALFAPLLALAGVYNATVYEEDACTGESISFAGGDVGSRLGHGEGS